jgi:hypothetical protein
MWKTRGEVGGVIYKSSKQTFSPKVSHISISPVENSGKGVESRNPHFPQINVDNFFVLLRGSSEDF